MSERPDAETAGTRSAGSPSRKQPLDEVGQSPDPRFTFANERTFLAWNRTALALIIAGLAASQILDVGFSGGDLLVAVPPILLGIAIALASYRNWEANERALRLGQPLHYHALDRLVAIGVAVTAVIVLVVVVIDRIGT